jgi:hypothetical protein
LPPLSSGSELTVRGGAGGSDVALYAYRQDGDKEEIVGKLNVLSFDEQVKHLYIIGVNNAKLPDAATLRNELNKIYAQAVVKWEVVEGRKINVTFANGQLTHGGSGAWKVYNADQKKVIEAYGEAEDKALYLFFVDGVQGKEGVRGYMPLQYQHGFIYDNPDAALIAHELAHGAFALYHTFSSERFIAPQGATANLMDYNNGAELWKHQWHLISDPKNLWFKSWQDEEEGEAAIKGVISILQKLRTARITNTSAEISLKKNAVLITGSSFYSFNRYKYKSIGIKARENISTMRVDRIQEDTHSLGPDKYYDLIVGDLLITLRSEEDRRMLYKYLTNAGNAILFVNGYRLNFGLSEKEDTDNNIATTDRHDYWGGIDLSFVNRLKGSKLFYADGHMSINTSNHKNMVNFLCSARYCIDEWPLSYKELRLKYGDEYIYILYNQLWYPFSVDISCKYLVDVTTLNTTPNLDGFNRRKAEGKIGGKNFVKQLQEASFAASDTLDIVCHSMGFAYALGMLEEIKTQIPDIKLGGFYIIAPENGCSGAVDPAEWQEIWQYGTNEQETPIYKQDGVAPQCKVGGLDDENNRAYIPDDVVQGFISSHSIGNYKWIFTQKEDQRGYVMPRK